MFFQLCDVRVFSGIKSKIVFYRIKDYNENVQIVFESDVFLIIR